MKILIVQKRFHPNSIGFVQALQRRGHEVAMVVHSRNKGIEVHYSSLNAWGQSIEEIFSRM